MDNIVTLDKVGQMIALHETGQQTEKQAAQQPETCPICSKPSSPNYLSEASWLPPAAVKMLRERHPSWDIVNGACPDCIQAALIEILVAQGGISLQEKMEEAHMLPPEIAFGVLPTPLRVPTDPRYRGRGVTLALVDAAFYPHPDLVQPRNRIRAWVDASAEPVQVRRFSPEETPQWPGWDNQDPYQWHGLMTSGVAAGNGQVSHGLYRGLASEAGLVLVQVRGANGRIGNENIARALTWLGEYGPEMGVRVVSISVGGQPVKWLVGNPVDEAVGALVRNNITVVVASGNSGARQLMPPATAPAALTIGGLDDKNNFDPEEVEVWHSNYGTTVTGMTKPELVAPSIWVAAPILPGSQQAEEAVALFAARPHQDESVERSIAEMKLITPHYQHVDGTSFAAPLVASVVACMLEANPSLTTSQIREILITTAQPVEGADRLRQGAGALEPARALGLALRAEGGPMIGFPLSPQVDENGVSFCIYDPDAHDVRLLGSWDDWNAPGIRAEQVQPHIWCARLPSLPQGTYKYRFVLDGSRWLYDPDNPRKAANDFGGFDSVLGVGVRE